jgi:hypothetical protein
MIRFSQKLRACSPLKQDAAGKNFRNTKPAAESSADAATGL